MKGKEHDKWGCAEILDLLILKSLSWLQKIGNWKWKCL